MFDARWIKSGTSRAAFVIRLPGLSVSWWIIGAPFWLIERGYPSLISANLGRLHVRFLPDYHNAQRKD